jgi:hypothetical protein
MATPEPEAASAWGGCADADIASAPIETETNLARLRIRKICLVGNGNVLSPSMAQIEERSGATNECRMQSKEFMLPAKNTSPLFR